MKFHALVIGGLVACAAPAHAIKIELRYDYDTNGFFNQPGSKEALRKVADYFESMIHDSLLSINPATDGGSWTAKLGNPSTGLVVDLVDLVVPQDTIIVYVGGRALGGPLGRGGFGGLSTPPSTASWANRVLGRGQPGALGTSTLRTDFAPWGGSIAFETGATWNFSTEFGQSGTSPFVSIAIHEMGHVLGIGVAPSWANKVSGGEFKEFTGVHSVAVFGSAVPLQKGTDAARQDDDDDHWQNDNFCGAGGAYDPSNALNILSKANGSFNTAHGYPQIAIMDPSLCNGGAFLKVFTDLDIAGLRDIGWEVDPPANFLTAQYTPSGGPFAFSWPSTTGFTYRLQTTEDLGATWSDLITMQGDGSIQSHTAPTPSTARAFYRLNTNPPDAPGAPIRTMAAATPPPVTGPQEIDEDGGEACDCHSSLSQGCP